MNDNIIYSNPVIESPRFLFVRIDNVEHHANRCTLIHFRVPLDTFKTDIVYSRLAHTDKAEQMWGKCRATFFFTGHDIQSAIGRFGKVYLVPSAWSNMTFSTVQFVNQTWRDRDKRAKL